MYSCVYFHSLNGCGILLQTMNIIIGKQYMYVHVACLSSFVNSLEGEGCLCSYIPGGERNKSCKITKRSFRKFPCCPPCHCIQELLHIVPVYTCRGF